MVEKTDYNTKPGKMSLSNPPTKEELEIQKAKELEAAINK